MKVAVYLRQSLDKTGLEAAVTRQREDGAALCLDRNWEWVEYMDNAPAPTTYASPGPPTKRCLQRSALGRCKASSAGTPTGCTGT
jgi:hypothetical protein